MFTNEANFAFVFVLCAVGALVAGGTRANEAPSDGVGVTHGTRLARVAGTRVHEVTQEASLEKMENMCSK